MKTQGFRLQAQAGGDEATGQADEFHFAAGCRQV